MICRKELKKTDQNNTQTHTERARERSMHNDNDSNVVCRQR